MKARGVLPGLCFVWKRNGRVFERLPGPEIIRNGQSFIPVRQLRSAPLGLDEFLPADGEVERFPTDILQLN